MVAYDAAVAQAEPLVAPFSLWPASEMPAAVATLRDLLSSLLIPSAPTWKKAQGTCPVGKWATKIRQLERLTARIVAATAAAQA
jgi:hypothetical protein